MAIRQTWANISDSSVKVIFTLGYSPFLQEYINKESSMFHDILQENFIDDYNNNTLKTVMAFNYFSVIFLFGLALYHTLPVNMLLSSFFYEDQLEEV
jgi:hypothetical protein